MTLHAEERLANLQEVMIGRSMGQMTFEAILHDISVFKNVRAFLVSMAESACLLNRRFTQHLIVRRAVRFMTVSTKNPVFLKRMMTRQDKFKGDLLMTLGTHFSRIPWFDLQIRVPKLKGTAYVVTVNTGNVTHRMRARIPVVKVKRSICSVTFQAYERLCLGREVLYINESFVIAGCLLPFLRVLLHSLRGQTLNRKTARSVT
jgi:hypothetical protein